MQGCVADCYFAAALAAVGWVYPQKLTGTKDPSDPDNYRIYTFYKAANQPISPPLRIAKPLPVNVAGQLVGAKPTTGTNVWISMYEKAYAVFKGEPANAPNITKLDSGNAVFALTEVMGANSDGKVLKTDYYTASTNSFNLSKLFTDINAKCGASPGTGGKTRVPMVAFTYKNSTLTPFGDAYDDDTIVANHAYTILGTMGTAAAWGNSVVLRNPFGIGKPGQPKTGIHDCKPSWSGTQSYKIAENNFAMEMDTFARYFEAYGYTI
jgi:hypothetical protein